MEVKIKLENGCENFCPKKAHPDDAGYDLYSRIDAVLEPLSGMAIPVGFAMDLPTGYEAQIRPRSGAVGEVLNWYFNRYLERNAADDEDFTQSNRQIQPNTLVRQIMLKVLAE